jgi:hypothetical protein
MAASGHQPALCKREHTGEVTFLDLRIPLENDDGKPRVGQSEIIEYLDSELLRGAFIFRLGCDCLAGDRHMALEPEIADDEAIVASVDDMIDGFKRQPEMFLREIGND